MPERRWIITKLDLLVAEAVGYKRRPTRLDGNGWPVGGPFTPVTVVNPATSASRVPLPAAKVNQPYSRLLWATGNVPTYRWSVSTGSLAPFALDPFTGIVSGTPTSISAPQFTVKAETIGFAPEQDVQDTQIRICGSTATLMDASPLDRHCWYLGAAGQSCTTACQSVGGFHAAGTTSTVGSQTQGGTNLNCSTALIVLTGVFTGVTELTGTSGLGCYAEGNSRVWRKSSALTASAQAANVRRVCACVQ
jgi:hypothetical protein